MLPPGHLAAGYLTTKLSINLLLSNYPQANDPRFWVLGMIASFIPDFDTIYSFIRLGGIRVSTKDFVHRKFITHAPFFHLFIALAGFLAGMALRSGDLQIFAILYWVGTWTHFICDSFSYGLMWLWPVSNRIFSIAKREQEFEIDSKNILGYWMKFIIMYSKTLVFYLELTVLVVALIIKFKIFH